MLVGGGIPGWDVSSVWLSVARLPQLAVWRERFHQRDLSREPFWGVRFPPITPSRVTARLNVNPPDRRERRCLTQ